MAFTRIPYYVEAAVTDYTFDFPYTNESQIRVLLNGTLLTQDVDYSFVDEYTIRLDDSLNHQDLDYLIIRRVLDFSVRPNNWTDNNRLPANEHNREDDEDLWRSQENYDNRGIPLSLVRDAWDAQDDQTDDTPTTKIIGNAGYAELLDDVVTIRYLEDRLTGQRAGLAGVFRLDPGTTGDGLEDTYELIPSDSASRIPTGSKEMVIVTFDGRVIQDDEYEVASNGRSIVFDNPVPNGVEIDAWVVTAALTTFISGSIAPPALGITESYILTGDSSGLGKEVARSTILITEWGRAASTFYIGADMDGSEQIVARVKTPTATHHAANKGYVDTAVAANKAFPSVTSGISYTLASAVLNNSGATQLVNMQILISTNISAGKTYELQYADDNAFSTNKKTAATYRLTSLGAQETSTMMALIPNGKYWRLAITSGSHPSSGIDFTYQIGGVS